MKHGSLFSGIGGFDLAADWMGWENVFHCEINTFCQKVLKYHFPGADSLTDITKTDFTKYNGTIDIISGGFPCQPYSLAGKRKGKEDERHLWPEMLRAIREVQPGWVVGENVFGLVNWSGGLVFHEVQADLEAEGYEVWPFLLPACGVDAPHKRERIWFIAYAGLQRQTERQQQPMGFEQLCEKWDAADSNSRGLEGSEKVRRNGINVEWEGEFRDVTDTGNERLQGRKINGSITGIGQNRNEQPAGLLQSTWQDFPAEPPLCCGNDGFPGKLDGITFSKWRTESIKALGNAIVPQVAFEIFKAIELF